MAQTVKLAVGATSATSSDITIASGSEAVVGIYRDAGELPRGYKARVYQDTPGSTDTFICELTAEAPVLILSGPGTFRIKRRAMAGVNVGVFSEE